MPADDRAPCCQAKCLQQAETTRTLSTQEYGQTASVSRFPHGRAFQPHPDDKRPLCSGRSRLDNLSEPRPSPPNFPEKTTAPTPPPRTPEGALVELRRDCQGHHSPCRETGRQLRKPKPSPRKPCAERHHHSLTFAIFRWATPDSAATTSDPPERACTT